MTIQELQRCVSDFQKWSESAVTDAIIGPDRGLIGRPTLRQCLERLRASGVEIPDDLFAAKKFE